jgi:putative ABC transport system ATP-binding protein
MVETTPSVESLGVVDLSRPGLSSTTFSLSRGECVAVSGPSGAGKSLLLRAIADLDPNQGRCTVKGADRNNLPPSEWRRKVAYLPAESGWWGETVAEHYGQWETVAARLGEVLLPDDAGDWSIGRLSTGEKQRLALLRALEKTPQVLLLDEPTGALDSKATEAVEKVVSAFLEQGGAALWVTHDAAQAKRIAKRHLGIAGGVVSEGWP